MTTADLKIWIEGSYTPLIDTLNIDFIPGYNSNTTLPFGTYSLNTEISGDINLLNKKDTNIHYQVFGLGDMSLPVHIYNMDFLMKHDCEASSALLELMKKNNITYSGI